jgi:predicted nucleic acid-binding protein
VSQPSSRGIWQPKGIVAVLDTSTLIRAWLSHADRPNAALELMLKAAQAYDSFTSPTILDEVEDVLLRPRIAASRASARRWLDAFLRSSRQVFPEAIPGGDPRAVGGDLEDLPVLHTAYAATVAGPDVAEVLATARADGGWFLVSENTRHFPPGQNVYGWQFTTASRFLQTLQRRGSRP